MANPSLQIGNSKWAIKEDNELGYSTAGTRFFPIPITMTRASAGTRVNSSGLVETVELLGSEEIVNGDFATDSDWNKGTGWSISGGSATLSVQAGSSSLSSSNMTVTVGKIYKVTVNVSATSTGFRLYDALGVVSYGLSLGENVFYRTPSSSIYTVTPLGLAGSSGTISNVSVKEYTANNLARVDYDGTASSLLVEPQRTNLVTYSELFNTGWWLKDASVIVTDNNETSPKGDITGSLIRYDASSQALYKSSLGLTGVYTFSIYFKANGTNVGKTVQVDVDGTTYYPTFTNEWVRHDFQTTNLNILQISNRGGSTISEGEFYAWGSQLELGSYATSYIPTSGSTVTRVRDRYDKAGISNLINSEEGVLFLEMAALANDSTNRQITISDGTNDNRLVLKYDNQSNVIQSFNRVSGTETAFLSYTVTDITVFNKIAIKYKLNDYALWVNGVEVATDLSASTFTGLNTFSFYSGAASFLGKVKQLQVFKTALTDTELATLTTQ